ncbi:hypothetical protein KEF85_10100 [Methylomonas paludis]|uniref:PBP domain-containing protein n=1 Tax=Methylomonas paludis TaxID=1173101 RepID=A0A975R924_9GAMM|nr:hypothetical protein [Methylomonas paludis]QWF69726.1 hypothetical protein KEF85_10100 [Methylomonas paludis]
MQNFKKLVAGSFVLNLALAFNAWALPPDATPDLAVYIPGSQSNDPAFGFLVNNISVANAVCLDAPNSAGTGTSHIYFQSGINDNYSAIYCYTDDTKIPGLTTGDATNHHKSKIWISRRRLGASFVGLDAVNHGTLLTYLKDPVTAGCTASIGSYSSGGATYQYHYTCTTATAGIAATAATSDVTPDVFGAADNVTPGSTPINAAQLDNVHALGGHIVGIPVTLLLRNALQYAEIQSGLLPNTCTVGDETAKCVPSLSKEQLVSLFTGAITDWSQFQVDGSNTLVDVVAAGVSAGVSPPTGTNPHGGLQNPTDTTVHVCRRENGAGQQVAVLANVLQYPCLGATAPELATPATATLGDIQYATSLGAVDKCLADYNDGTSTWFGTTNPSPYPNPPSAGTAHGTQWALSIQTTERNATNKANYRFIAIDSAIPTGLEAYLGHYRLVGNYALSWKSASNSANQNAALNAIAAYSKLPTTIAARNISLSNQSFGQAGYIALSDNGYTPPLVWDPTNPVTPYSKLDAHGKPNACVLPTANTNYGQVQLQ